MTNSLSHMLKTGQGLPQTGGQLGKLVLFDGASMAPEFDHFVLQQAGASAWEILTLAEEGSPSASLHGQMLFGIASTTIRATQG